MEPKAKLRQTAKQYRASLTPGQVESASKIVCEGLKQAVDWGRSKSVHCYAAVGNEIDPAGFVGWLVEQHGAAVHLQDLSGNFPDATFDAIIVPGLAFDRRGNRIGHGKGHYDKFLALQPKALKIGLSYDELVLGKIPKDKHDISMDMIVTEKELYNF